MGRLCGMCRRQLLLVHHGIRLRIRQRRMRQRNLMRCVGLSVVGVVFLRLLAEHMRLHPLGCRRLAVRYLLRLRVLGNDFLARMRLPFMRLCARRLKRRRRGLVRARLLLGWYSALGLQRLLLKTVSVLRPPLLHALPRLLGLMCFLLALLVVLDLAFLPLRLLGFPFLTLLLFSLQAGLCLALLHITLFVFTLLGPALTLKQCMCLQWVFAVRRMSVLRRCLLEVFAYLGRMLLVRNTLLLVAFLPRLRRACGLQLYPHIQHQLRAG